MYRESTYEIHNETMDHFAELFNSCRECPNLEFIPNPEETFGNDGYIIDHDSGKSIGYDWERRDDHFKNGEFDFDTLGQYERKLIKDNIQISLQCDETDTAVAVGWHKDWLKEVKTIKALKTDSKKKQQGEVRYTREFKIFKYDEISELKRYIDEMIKTDAYRFDSEEMRRNIVRTINQDGYDLDDQQIDAVLCSKKYEQVVAGAGAGKTMTVSAKVRYLTECLEAEPRDILVLSFSRETVKELREKIIPGCHIFTFHALGYAILGHEGDVKDTKLKKFLTDCIRAKISDKEYDEDFADSLQQFFECDQSADFTDEEEPTDDLKTGLNEIFSTDGIKAEGENLINLLRVFIEQMKINGLKEDAFDVWKNEAESARTVLFLEICKPLFTAYRDYLCGKHLLDFSDMINDAEARLLKMAEDKRSASVRKYKYIIVDEYQDISLQRFNLIKALISYSGEEFKQLMVVGDDWQAIYAFSGAKVDLFTGFKELTKAGDDHECIKLVNTYRNPQALIDIAGDFVSKNPKQIRKELRSKKQYENGKEILNPVNVISYEKGSEVWACCEALRRLKQDRIKDGRKVDGSVLILGRFRFNGNNLNGRFPHFDDDPDMMEMKHIFTMDADGVHLRPVDEELKDMTDIRYMTVHRSKGLEAEDVIVLGMDEDKKGYGFPCTKEDDDILSLVNKKETMENTIRLRNKLWSEEMKVIDYPEERRLFYVALTRTKNRVYLLGREDSLSRYAGSELIEDNKADEKRSIREIKYVCEELKKYEKIEQARKEYLKSAYIIDDKGNTAAPVYKVFMSIREIYEKTNYVSVKESTLLAFLKGAEEESVTRRRNWGSLDRLTFYGCLRETGIADIEILISKMIDTGLLYRGWFDKPVGKRDFVRYGKKQVDKWNTMSDEDAEAFMASLKTDISKEINDKPRVAIEKL